MRPSKIAARAIAKQVSLDFDLYPRLDALTVQMICTPPHDEVARRQLYGIYGDDLAASIESRILQEADVD